MINSKPSNTYQINILYKHVLDKNANSSNGLLLQIIQYLVKRGYSYNPNKKQELKFFHSIYFIDIQNNAKGFRFYTIHIICKTEWFFYEKDKKEEQIACLINDLFSAEKYWTVLEMLAPPEVNSIRGVPRTISPFKIIDWFNKHRQEWDYQTKKPFFKKINSYADETIITWGSSTIFKNSIDFWLSYCAWDFQEVVMYEEHAQTLCLNDYENYSERFNLGDCLPSIPQQQELIIKQIQTVVPDLKGKSFLECYHMRKDWDDYVYLFVFEGYFVTYNWWTGN